jgi:hypothetical protein
VKNKPTAAVDRRQRTHPPTLLAAVIILAGLLAMPGIRIAQSAPSTAQEESAAFSATYYKTFAEWKAACAKLPTNRTLRRGVAPKELLPLKSFKEFDEVIEGFYAESKTGMLSRTNLWVGEVPTREQFFNTDQVYFRKGTIPFQPFAAKLSLPKDAEIVFRGDLHGDVHSVNAWIEWLNRNKYLDGFKLTRPNLHVVLLGDYTDRGMYGIEVLYTLFRLKLENPGRVWLIRGNHEDVTLAINYGFLAEIQAKYGREFNATKILRGYDFLPVALYLGTGGDFIQCSHGGMEPGFDPAPLLNAAGAGRFQLLGTLTQSRFLHSNPDWVAKMDPESRRVAEAYLKDFRPENPVAPTTLGFMWNDFSLVREEPQLAYDPGRAFIYGDRSTEHLFAAGSKNGNTIRAAFRAHQHSSVPNPMMRRLKASNGLFRHWQEKDSTALLPAPESTLRSVIEHEPERSIPANSVWTFNVSPDTVYGEGCDFDFDTFAILKLAEGYENWRLRVINLPTNPK